MLGYSIQDEKKGKMSITLFTSLCTPLDRFLFNMLLESV